MRDPNTQLGPVAYDLKGRNLNQFAIYLEQFSCIIVGRAPVFPSSYTSIPLCLGYVVRQPVLLIKTNYILVLFYSNLDKDRGGKCETCPEYS